MDAPCEQTDGRLGEYLVEVYLPAARAPELSASVARARAVAREMAQEGTPVRYLRSYFVPEDETCFHFFGGPSAEAVGEASARARLGEARIREAIPRVTMEGEWR